MCAWRIYSLIWMTHMNKAVSVPWMRQAHIRMTYKGNAHISLMKSQSYICVHDGFINSYEWHIWTRLPVSHECVMHTHQWHIKGNAHISRMKHHIYVCMKHLFTHMNETYEQGCQCHLNALYTHMFAWLFICDPDTYELVSLHRIWAISLCAPCLLHLCDMTHSYVLLSTFEKVAMQALRFHCVRHDSFISVTWLIYFCDMTHSYMSQWTFQKTAMQAPHFHCVYNDSLMCVTYLIYVCRSELFRRHNAGTSFSLCVPWLIYFCDMTHSYLWHNSFVCATWAF